jgi:3-deoxy-D-manno-octulosonic-acid transferase
VAHLLNLVYLLLLLCVSPWLLYQAIFHGKYRAGFAAKLLGRVPRRTGDAPCIWLHAVSVGEVNLLGPLINQLRARRPDCTVVISSTTATGFELARRVYPQLAVFYCPLDFTWATQTAMRRVRPDLLVLAELELWPNLIRAARRQATKIAVINGRLSDNSFRGYRRLGPFMRGLLAKIDLIVVQNEQYAQRFRALGADPQRIHISGSIKFDGAQTDRENPTTQRLRALAGFEAGDSVLLAGSTQSGEEAAALDAFRACREAYPALRLILVPRHPHRFRPVARWLASQGEPFVLRSALGPQDAGPTAEVRILLVDAVGELGAWWGTADVGFVGGSLGSRGGQNMIEPAAFGAAVCFGPNTRNFRDVVTALLAEEAAVVVEDTAALTRFVRDCLEDEAYRHGLGQRAQNLVLAQQGATRRTMDWLLQLVPQAKSPVTTERGTLQGPHPSGVQTVGHCSGISTDRQSETSEP